MTEAKTETAFVLPAEAVAGSSEPVHFGGGFPGVWYPGQPIAVSELGFPTLAAAREAKKTLAPDLVEKTVKTGSAPMPEIENHIPFTPPPDNEEASAPTAIEEPGGEG